MRAIGIILAGGNNSHMRDLSKKRAIAAMPVAGSFRAIDFVLSNMTNSHIQKVAVLTQYNSRSLNEHLSSSKWWDFGRKQGGLFVFTPTITADNSFWYRGTADAIMQNMTFLRNSHEPYVVIASGDGIYKLDYRKVLAYHVDKQADITVVTTQADERDDIGRFGVVKTDSDGRIVDYEEKPLVASSSTISAGIYIIRRRLLMELLETAAAEDRYDLVKDVIIRYKDVKRVYAYSLSDYWSSISTVEAYYRTNMDFLKRDVQNFFFRTYPDVYSKIDDMPPAKYNPQSHIKNSLISAGCILNGEVEGSVLFKKVYVGNGAVIKNCIVLNDVYIGDGAHLENCIIESRNTIKPGATYIGTDGPLVVSETVGRYEIERNL